MSLKLVSMLLPVALVPLLGGCVNAQSGGYSDNRYTSYNTAGYQYADGQLDALLAPIALYPDTLLSHILIASTYPLEVAEAERFIRNNPSLSGDAAVTAANRYNWDPSVAALTAFPDVLTRMVEDPEWTDDLGDAFLNDEGRVMASVQRLRNRAYDSGNLAQASEVRVQRENSIVVIEPRRTNVYYAPYYDTRVIYGDWWWPDYPPTYWYSPARLSIGSSFYWGPQVHLSSGFYFSSFNWHRRNLMVLDRPHWRNTYQRPIYAHPNARPWRHNPLHRRDFGYRDGPAHDRFAPPHTRPATPIRRPDNRSYRAERFAPQRDAVNRRPVNDRAPNRPADRVQDNRYQDNRYQDNRYDGHPSHPASMNRPGMNRPDTPRADHNRIEQQLRERAQSRQTRPDAYRTPTQRLNSTQQPNNVAPYQGQRINTQNATPNRDRVINTSPQPVRSDRAQQYLQQQESKRQWRESQTRATQPNQQQPPRQRPERPQFQPVENRVQPAPSRIEQARPQSRPQTVQPQQQIRDTNTFREASPRQEAPRLERFNNQPSGNGGFNRPQFRERPERGQDR